MSWRRFFRRRFWDEERARELDSYLDLETDDNIARGMGPEEARQAARRKLGNVTRIREEIYRMNTIGFIETFWQDTRFGARLLRLNPGFTAVALLSLALGIGANTAIFQLLDTVRLRTLPVRDPQQLAEVRVDERRNVNGRTGAFTGGRPMLTNPLWEQIRERQEAFSGMLAWGSARFNLAQAGESRYAQGLWVSGDFFNVLQVPPVLGRVMTAADDRHGCPSPAAVISFAFWQREYGGEASAVGSTLRLDGHPFEIVGVTPPSFFGVEVGKHYDVAVPMCAEPIMRGHDSGYDKRDVWWLAALGRLKPGWSLERASAQLASISGAVLHETLPPKYSAEDSKNYLAFVLAAFPAGTGVSDLRRIYEAPLTLLLAITGLVLLIACANLANLMLARATAREREIAVRLAIGASRGRVVRQLMAESLLLATVGALMGVGVAQGLSRFLVSFLRTGPNRVFLDLEPDLRVLAFTAALAVLTCLLFGLAPALRATRAAPGTVMKTAGRGIIDSRSRLSLRRSLVVVQVALSLVLVVGAVLFTRTLHNLMTLDPGFGQDGLLVTNLDLRRAEVPPERLLAFYREIEDRVARAPGVASSASLYIVPVSGSAWNNRIVIGGAVQKKYPNFNRVGTGFFRTMGTPLLAGRDFDERDTLQSPPVAIVNESFARTFLPGRDPLGAVFQIEEPPGAPRPFYQVVGVVKDTKYRDLRDPFSPLALLAMAQEPDPGPFVSLLVRSEGEIATVVASVKQAVLSASPAVSIDFKVFKTQLRDSLLRERLMATLSGFFGALAVVLATVGLYGVMSYSVARRRGEIGLRMALGADRRDVIGMIMREAGTLLAGGVVVGTALALVAARSAGALLYGLQPGDPATLALAVSALTAVAAAASYLPAQRAARLEPTAALREE
ncbi:MAG TPA: ABC transporter permease [Vicinamibacteria bacterium]|nr:ABC transporter permease [Vicinamibacteria bacterium]